MWQSNIRRHEHPDVVSVGYNIVATSRSGLILVLALPTPLVSVFAEDQLTLTSQRYQVKCDRVPQLLLSSAFRMLQDREPCRLQSDKMCCSTLASVKHLSESEFIVFPYIDIPQAPGR